MFAGINTCTAFDRTVFRRGCVTTVGVVWGSGAKEVRNAACWRRGWTTYAPERTPRMRAASAFARSRTSGSAGPSHWVSSAKRTFVMTITMRSLGRTSMFAGNLTKALPDFPGATGVGRRVDL